MSDMYRIVVLNASGQEVAIGVSLAVRPSDLLVIMPASLDTYLPTKQMEAIADVFGAHGITGIVLPFPATFARLERTEP
jgi:hypothetical protein